VLTIIVGLFLKHCSSVVQMLSLASLVAGRDTVTLTIELQWLLQFKVNSNIANILL